MADKWYSFFALKAAFPFFIIHCIKSTRKNMNRSVNTIFVVKSEVTIHNFWALLFHNEQTMNFTLPLFIIGLQDYRDLFNST